MKCTLMIEGSPVALAAILASLPGDTPVSVVQQPAPSIPSPTGDDDEAGDTPVAAGPGQVDSEGLPHDPRIHSETPTFTGKGAWRKRRGVTKEEIAAVEAELRAHAFAPPVQPMQPAPAPVVAQPMTMPPVTDPTGAAMMPPVTDPTGAAMMPPVQSIPPMQPAPAPMVAQPMTMPPVQPAPAPVVVQPVAAPAPVVVQPVAAPPTDFANFMAHISEKMKETDPATGKPLITADYLQQVTNEIATAFQQPLSVITDIGANPQMITYAAQVMARDGRW